MGDGILPFPYASADEEVGVLENWVPGLVWSPPRVRSVEADETKKDFDKAILRGRDQNCGFSQRVPFRLWT